MLEKLKSADVVGLEFRGKAVCYLEDPSFVVCFYKELYFTL